ncbi:MAG: GMC family oxidoreductase [Rhabdochlamydiaceae bacterium]|nr:GMC family oxidoreductase [Rhabdochlamydiaceae bacterium]
MEKHHYDVIIIGSGAGGGTLAHRLSASGKKILVLERGEYLPREKENWSSKATFFEGRYSNAEEWLDKEGKAFQPGTHYFVGGNTKVYGAALLRMREKDFGKVLHYGGISPAWPLSYEDFKPYYLEAEKLYHVHGHRGSDPTEPSCDDPYPYPAVKHEPRIQKLSDDLEKAGYHPFPLPLGLLLDEQNRPHSPCIKCNTCDGFPCMVDGKADAQVVCLEPALKHPNVHLLTGCYVERLDTTPSGKEISQVVVKRNGHREIYKGNIIVVSCGSINSAALLLRSTSDQFPNGLANSSDLVGRNYMCHNNSALVVLTLEKNPTQFQKTLAINDFYYSAPDSTLPLGHIQMLGKTDQWMFKGDAPPLTPNFALNTMAHHSLDFWLTSEDLPDPNNRVVVGKDGRIHLNYTENNLEGHHRLLKKLKFLLNHLGIKHHTLPCSAYFGKKIPLAAVGHQNGTMRFGTDPKTSVLDINCKAHDLDNLYVVDGSFFVSSSAVNPTLTIIANALRVADHLLERLK